MKGLAGRSAILHAGLAMIATSSAAQRRIRGGHAVLIEPPAVGFRVGYDFQVDHSFVGGQLNLPVGTGWALVPSADLYPGLSGSVYRLNADLKFHPATRYGVFCLGGGFTYQHVTTGADGGANIFAGFESRRARPFRPFLDARLVFADGTAFNIEGGINFPL